MYTATGPPRKRLCTGAFLNVARLERAAAVLVLGTIMTKLDAVFVLIIVAIFGVE